MRSTLFGSSLVLCLALGLAAPALAQHKNKRKDADSGDRSLDKQMAWEQKVMGDDGGKAADMKKIAAAQKLAAEARKHPEPAPAPKVKDPNKEGVRAKQEASIGLPIESEQEQASRALKKNASTKRAEPSSSANDELGALVASSLAQEKSSGSSAKNPLLDDNSESKRGVAAKGRSGKAGKRGKAARSAPAASSEPSSLDKMFAAGK